MKKILSLILALAIVLSNFSYVFSAPSQKELYNQSGNILKNLGILKGSETGDLMLNKILKRQDMVILISRLYKEEEKAKKFSLKDNFHDVNSTFYQPYISWGLEKELITGIQKDKFGFNEPVKVQQFQTLLLRALGYSEEVKNYKNVPEVAKSLGLMEGLSVEPNEYVERGLMAVMTINALKLNIRGGSLTLAQKLNLDIPNIFDVTVIPAIDRNNVRFEGVAKYTNNLKIHLKPLSSNITFGEKHYDIPLDKTGEFSHLIKNLQLGKYEYKFSSGPLSTKAQTFIIEELSIDLNKKGLFPHNALPI